MKRFLRWFAIVFLSAGLIGGVVAMLTGQSREDLPMQIVTAIVCSVCIFLLLRKKPATTAIPYSNYDYPTHLKKNRCPVCGKPLLLSGVRISDKKICKNCNRICLQSPLATSMEVFETWKENHRRFHAANPQIVERSIKDRFIFVDTVNKLAYVAKSKKPIQEPIVFRFDEVEEYSISVIGQKTIIRTKNGIYRSAVGSLVAGPVGAIVGAATAKKEQKTIGGRNLLAIRLNISGLRTTITLDCPPKRAGDIMQNICNF